ncbi:hypothetical protein [Ralstonia pseudosolanacearum]|uniref:hypothetical protein n=1 Tax=Ralstonia pseudosolanacearum TaxID=1310165 RepID=UPI002676D519|nr:hypothetical protein [Ralstonia pseudosolanacearum]MDO3518145.1 hypothetical protein [Ralstonia pseudosolanacearum]MDO3540664.1 hypothetical protein [Ralstonia pseudosolanacearum]
MPIPSPEERPDLYDGYDFQEPKTPMSEAYWNRVMPEHLKKRIAERQTMKPAEAVPTEAPLDFGTIPDDLKKDLVPRTTQASGNSKIEYFEVEGAVFRKRTGVPLELFDQKTGTYEPYTGDVFRIYRQSNPMSLEEVRPYMDVAPKE